MVPHLKVKAGSKVDRLFYNAAGLLTAKIKKVPAQDGPVNAYLTEYLARQFGPCYIMIYADFRLYQSAQMG